MTITSGFKRESVTATKVAYTVAHHVNGRIRLQIPRLASDKDFSRRLAATMQMLPFVNRVRVNPLAQSLVIHYSGPMTGQGMLGKLGEAIQTSAQAETAVALTNSKEAETEESGQIPYFKRLGLPVLGLGLGAGAAAGLGLPSLLVGGTILIAATPIFKRSVQGIREEKKLTVDFLDSMAIVLLTAQASFLAPAFIVGVIESAEILRDWTARRSKNSSLKLLLDQERQIMVERAGAQTLILVEDLEIDDVVLVYPGDQIPVDGLVLDGRAAVDQHRVTGDSIPVICTIGDQVYASSLVIEGRLCIQVQQTGQDTHVGQVMTALQAVPETDTRVSNYARRVGNWAVVPTLLTGGLVLGTSGSLPQATSIINMDMGTGMRVSSPIAVLSAQSNAAEQGILIRSGRALEALSQIDTILFDKTATLTTGKAEIVAIHPVDGLSAHQLLTLAASAELALGHPIAESIVRYAHAEEVVIRPCTEWNYLPGLGVEARVDRRLLLVGNEQLMVDKGISLVCTETQLLDPHLDTATRVYVAQDGELAGIIYCADPIRAESAAVIRQLQGRQIEPLLVSGDGRAVTDSVAAQVGIAPENVFAEALPQQKLQIVKSLQEDGRRVAFVGDGINDTAAMLQADVAISLGSATDLAQESADIVLMNSNLQDLIKAKEIADHAMHLLQQNRTLVVATNAGAIVYGTLAALNPIAAVAINNGSALAAALNSLRPAQDGTALPISQKNGQVGEKRVTGIINKENTRNGRDSSRSPGWKFWQRQSTAVAKANNAPSQTAENNSAALVTITDGGSTTQIHFQIKHWVKGRIRIVIPHLEVDPVYNERLQYLITGTSSAFSVRVNPKAQSLVIRYDPQAVESAQFLQEIIICIKNAAKVETAIEPASTAAAPEEVEPINYLKRLGLPAICLALTVGTFAGLAVPPLLLAGTVIAAAIPSYRRAWQGIRYERKLNVDFLDSTAITLLTATGFYFPPALMVSLIESGEIIRDLTARRTARANLDLLDSLGKTARVERNGVEVEIPLAELVEGEIVVVYAGDQIPVDGTVLSGLALVDQQKLTGESIPVIREEGQDVFAATLLADGMLRIETRRTGENTRAGVVVALMKAAPVHDTRMEDYARKVGDRVVIPTLLLGGAVTVATGGNILRGVGVITLDIGTGVRVSVPTAILASLTYAARQGILIRSGRAIEQLAKVDTIVFDKTGTLTQGNAGVVGIYVADETVDAVEVLWLAATSEQGLTHPVAEAMVRHAREKGVALGECEEWEYRVGQGIAAVINGRAIFVGSQRMMGNLGVDMQPILAANPDIEASAASQVYVAEDGRLLGVILYKDPARPESVAVISDLHRMKITPYMLSGDMQKVATAVATELHIEPENVFAEAFPERKVEVIKALQESGRTIAFVGDGINDSAALAHASVSVSFAGATDMARETADIVLMDNDLSALIMAIHISKHAMRVVRQNVGIVVVPNASGMVIAALIGLDPVAAVLLNNGSAIVAELNGFRPLLGPPGRRKKAATSLAEFAALKQSQAQAALPSKTNGQNGQIETDLTAYEPVVVKATAVNGNGANGHVEVTAVNASGHHMKLANGAIGEI